MLENSDGEVLIVSFWDFDEAESDIRYECWMTLDHVPVFIYTLVTPCAMLGIHHRQK